MKLNLMIDTRTIGRPGERKAEAFRNNLIEALKHRFGGELPDSLGARLEAVSVEVGDYSHIDIEGHTTSNEAIIKRVVHDVIKSTTAQADWQR
ncbi:hypothetical protein AB5J03_003726 [Yersinia enterocolitica]|nr:hypothetical protein [Yersinia enterocolitica]EKN5083313.1 hypothetical protein [Yersinia enterocolitica]EKN6401856.1 hypothetical protein [Yersinia enterocolitica]EKP3833958.1 hypothetical protein [Yersinia enterocolitica]ELI8137439.1 hypothetical protein [Yersinia enterocolitica]